MKNITEKIYDMGLLFQTTLPNQSINNKIISSSCYWGIDPTSETLHIGHFINLLVLKEMYDYGIKVFILIGDFTCKIGDPTFKNFQRKLLNIEEIKKNLSSLCNMLMILINKIGLKAEFLYNSTWLNIDLNKYLEIASLINIRDIFDSKIFENRLKSNNPMYFNELMYSTLQAYDFLHLFNTYDCNLQIGGQDQWTNMLAGQELIRKINNKKAYVLTVPLLINNKGNKIGKSELNSSISIDFINESEFFIWNSIFSSDNEILLKFKQIFEIKQDDYKNLRIDIANKIIKILYNEEISNMIGYLRNKIFEKNFIIEENNLTSKLRIFYKNNIKFKNIIQLTAGFNLTCSLIDEFLKNEKIILNNKKIIFIDDFYSNLINGINVIFVNKNYFCFIVKINY